jgi:DNA-binding beta-propeller fold protein YncE
MKEDRMCYRAIARIVTGSLVLGACNSHQTTPPAAPAPLGVVPPASELVAKAYPIPGTSGPVSLDYIVTEAGTNRIWIPVGNTGSVDVFNPTTGGFDVVLGFKTAERESHGRSRMLGPSAVAIGDDVAYIGNRATAQVCVVPTKSLKLGECLTLPQPTDGVAYVASAKEVWVTTPQDHSLTVLDASDPRLLKPKAVIKLDGNTEGYAVDGKRGLFFTNLEDKDRTVVVDIKTHQVKAVYEPQCGEAGPRGIAVDPARDFVIVACTDHVQVLDGAHEGARLGQLDTGAGVDNLDYLPSGLLFVAAGRAARLTIAKLDDQGRLTIAATAHTADGARNAVADSKGNAYVADPINGRLLVFGAAP